MRREVLALLRLISHAVLAVITGWTDGVSCLRMGASSQSDRRRRDCRTWAIFGILDGIFRNTGCTLENASSYIWTQGRGFFLQHRLLRQCNGATRPHCSTVHTNVDALEYAKAEFILQRVVTCLLIQPFVLKAITSKGLSRLLIFLMTAGGDLTCTFPKSLPGASFSTNDKNSTSIH